MIIDNFVIDTISVPGIFRKQVGIFRDPVTPTADNLSIIMIVNSCKLLNTVESRFFESPRETDTTWVAKSESMRNWGKVIVLKIGEGTTFVSS